MSTATRIFFGSSSSTRLGLELACDPSDEDGRGTMGVAGVGLMIWRSRCITGIRGCSGGGDAGSDWGSGVEVAGDLGLDTYEAEKGRMESQSHSVSRSMRCVCRAFSPCAASSPTNASHILGFRLRSTRAGRPPRPPAVGDGGTQVPLAMASSTMRR